MTREEAKTTRAAIAVALAEKDEWPTELMELPAVKRYLAVKAGNDAHDDDKKLIEQYADHLRINSRSSWKLSVKSHLIAASNFTANLLTAKTPMLTDFLNAIHDTRSTATRNRALASLSGFYRWLRLRGILPKGYNPLEGIKILHEEHAPEVIWEKNEIPALTKAADTMRDGIAVWVAIYAGLRRGEIHRLQWKDVTPAYIIVKKPKTGKMRHVPLSSTLAKRLAKESKKGLRVVPWSFNRAIEWLSQLLLIGHHRSYGFEESLASRTAGELMKAKPVTRKAENKVVQELLFYRILN
ncbi:MAG: tyrosine-type recombinase/integrase [Planctomycetes bacterium]|nr:tyrosine-type recombinase/integrase [Planctomycetota bacterium]